MLVGIRVKVWIKDEQMERQTRKLGSRQWDELKGVACRDPDTLAELFPGGTQRQLQDFTVGCVSSNVSAGSFAFHESISLLTIVGLFQEIFTDNKI